jgi:NAD-specific glutamate dehydrogenase
MLENMGVKVCSEHPYEINKVYRLVNSYLLLLHRIENAAHLLIHHAN